QPGMASPPDADRDLRPDGGGVRPLSGVAAAAGALLRRRRRTDPGRRGARPDRRSPRPSRLPRRAPRTDCGAGDRHLYGGARPGGVDARRARAVALARRPNPRALPLGLPYSVARSPLRGSAMLTAPRAASKGAG